MVFGFFKKKKDSANLEMPLPPEEKHEPIGDFPAIRPSEERSAPKEEPSDFPEMDFDEEAAESSLPEPPRPEDVFNGEMPAPPSKFLGEEPEIAPEVFDKTIEEEVPMPVSRPRLKPIFVGVDEYSKINENANAIRGKIMEADEFVKRLNHLKVKETELLSSWKTRLEDLDRKLNFVDELVGKAQR
jgi:hypothetical protein